MNAYIHVMRPSNTWVQVALTRRGNAFTLYWNGEVLGSAIANVNLDSPSSLKIGHRGIPADTPGSTGSNGLYLNGSVDEVEVFSRALRAAEIRDIY
ncbi:MAG: LamG-like jellyroll fold domain-containing protein, partial [Anaerolineae bacterium]